MGEVRGTKTSGYIAQISGTVVGAGKTQQMLDLLGFRPKNDWKLRGNCSAADVDLNLFFNDEESGFDRKQRRVRIETAVSICHSGDGCPVMEMCEKYHNRREKEWMVVGGRAPGRRAAQDRSDAPRPGLGHARSSRPYTGKIIKEFCNQGHNRLLPGALGPGGECRECTRIRNRKRKRGATMAA